jgi:hypothetical protein
LDDLNYKVLELEHLQTLSLKHKDKEAEERKEIADLIERIQEDLEDQVHNKNFILLAKFFMICN